MKIENLYSPLLYISNQAVRLPILSEKPTLQSHRAEDYLINAMNSYPQIHIMYMGYEDGDFYEIISLKGSFEQDLKDALQAPDDAAYAILRQFSVPLQELPVRLWKFLNISRQTIGSRKQEYTDFDPRLRPWYKNAMNTVGTVKTDPYFFPNVKKMGMTMSSQIDGDIPGVFGADMLLDDINFFLKEISFDSGSQIVIFNSKLNIIASSQSEMSESMEMEQSLVVSRFFEFLKTENLQAEMNLKLKTEKGLFLVKVKKIPRLYGNNEYLFLSIPEKQILEPISASAKESTILSILILLLSFPLILLIAGRISSPIKKLAREVEKISRNDFSGDISVKTRIREIYSLANEMNTMKKGLRQFNKYVPSSLVNALLEKGTEAKIGGETKNMSFLFSDIAHFTALGENMDPEILMKRLSGYFEIISRIARQYSGTIDKFIGDSMMAFWNAPLEDKGHVDHVCQTALMIQQKLSEINKVWLRKGMMTFETRIGINTGSAVVGNMGSTDRMNYTVIGDTVNLCSRLESLNKRYGTNIIAGESVVEKASSEYIFRPLEKVVVLGKSKPEIIYELIGSREDLVEDDINFFNHFTIGFNLFFQKRWNEAEEAFSLAEKITHDNVLNLYKKTCRAYKENPPDNDWTGVFEMKDK